MSRLSEPKTHPVPDSGSEQTPNPEDAVDSSVPKKCVERVLKRWQFTDPGTGTQAEVEDLLAELVAALEGGAERVAPDSRLLSVTGRRLLTLLRSELLAEWSRGSAPPTPYSMLATLAAFESVGMVIESGWDRQLSGGLSGPDGLSLVVEVAHDLRSPLTSILFLAETLQRGQSGDVNELQHRQLGLIYSAALGLSTVASNVIELARGGERLADDQPAPFSVTDILESVHDIVHPMAEEKGLTVRLLPPASDHRLGYPHALSRVLLNLTTNALKFTEDGFVEIVTREVDLTLVEFSVRDSGPGISGKALETLYLPFRPSGDRYAFSGTGLGLELSRRLVEAMGSELLVETKPRWGTRFYFTLRLKPV